MLEREIPSSSERIPVIGMGTWQTFNTTAKASPVIQEWAALGGKLIDSSPMYGKAEEVIGDLTGNASFKDNLFYATKVWTTGRQQGIRQMEQSFAKMGRQKIDLMQIHNLVDWKVHLPVLRKMKEEGKIRYIGITHYRDSSHQELARIIQAEPVDFVQFNYSLFDRHAEDFLLPTAADKGVAVLVNRPFGEGSVLKHWQHRQLPNWALEYHINSWADFILKYIIAHPAVTCVIPATQNSLHAADNTRAGSGFVPDEAFRKKMVKFIEEAAS